VIAAHPARGERSSVPHTVRGAAGNPGFSTSAVVEDGRTILAVRGEVQLDGASALRDELLGHLRVGPVVLDLSGVTFLDSVGVRVLSHALRMCEEEGRELRVRPRLTDAAREILEMTGMLAVLPFEPGEEDA
jgi:anti-sigma B factor antagonist